MINKVDTNYEWYLATELPVSFEIKYSNDIFSKQNTDLISDIVINENTRRLVIVDLKVSKYYINKISEYFDYHNIGKHIIVVDATEKNKNIETLLHILMEMERFGVSRLQEPIIAIGGGVLLDIVGLAASLYRRGVPYIKIPTTLLGIVDASIGVKTGINFEDRRNRLGSYYPPLSVFLDKTFLHTLESIEISSALGEILKLAVVKDIKLYNILKMHGKKLYETKFLKCLHADEVISRSIKGMKDELQDNLWEKNLKRYVDFGHSFSPIPEMRSLTDKKVPSLTHGQAVTLDIIFSSIISSIRGMLTIGDVQEIIAVTKRMELPTYHPYFSDPNFLIEALNDTVKHRNGNQNLPIPRKIGESIFLNDISYNEIKKATKLMLSLNDK